MDEAEIIIIDLSYGVNNLSTNLSTLVNTAPDGEEVENMALDSKQKAMILNSAVEITKAAAGSGAPGCYSGENLAITLEKTYAKLLELAEKVNS